MSRLFYRDWGIPPDRMHCSLGLQIKFARGGLFALFESCRSDRREDSGPWHRFHPRSVPYKHIVKSRGDDLPCVTTDDLRVAGRTRPAFLLRGISTAAGRVRLAGLKGPMYRLPSLRVGKPGNRESTVDEPVRTGPIPADGRGRFSFGCGGFREGEAPAEPGVARRSQGMPRHARLGRSLALPEHSSENRS
jgi:hypothetical protein